MISMESPNIIIVVGHQLNREDAIRSSPVKFILGGVAMFIRLTMSHQAVIIGRMLWRPRVRTKIRVLVRS